MRSEAEFSPATAWCPNPGWWSADDDQATEREVTELVAAFVRALQPELVVETGSYTGQTSEAIAQALVWNCHGHLVTVEIDPERAQQVSDALAGMPATVICAAAGDVLASWLRDSGVPVGFAWLDSGPKSRRGELASLLPYLDDGAVIGVHDTRPGRPIAGVLDRDAFDVLTLRTPRGVSFAQVRRRDG